LDRLDGAVKPYFMPNTVFEQIEALQVNPDYAFDEVPMLFDVTLNATGAGKKEVVYTIVPARNNVPLTEKEISTVSDAGSIRDLQKALNAKTEGKVGTGLGPSDEAIVGLT
jgi:hypothetical protein